MGRALPVATPEPRPALKPCPQLPPLPGAAAAPYGIGGRMKLLRAWRKASKVIADAQASVCLRCTGRNGECTCTRKCDYPDCAGKP